MSLTWLRKGVAAAFAALCMVNAVAGEVHRILASLPNGAMATFTWDTDTQQFSARLSVLVKADIKVEPTDVLLNEEFRLKDLVNKFQALLKRHPRSGDAILVKAKDRQVLPRPCILSLRFLCRGYSGKKWYLGCRRIPSVPALAANAVAAHYLEPAPWGLPAHVSVALSDLIAALFTTGAFYLNQETRVGSAKEI